MPLLSTRGPGGILCDIDRDTQHKYKFIVVSLFQCYAFRTFRHFKISLYPKKKKKKRFKTPSRGKRSLITFNSFASFCFLDNLFEMI